MRFPLDGQHGKRRRINLVQKLGLTVNYLYESRPNDTQYKRETFGEKDSNRCGEKTDKHLDCVGSISMSILLLITIIHSITGISRNRKSCPPNVPTDLQVLSIHNISPDLHLRSNK